MFKVIHLAKSNQQSYQFRLHRNDITPATSAIAIVAEHWADTSLRAIAQPVTAIISSKAFFEVSLKLIDINS